MNRVGNEPSERVCVMSVLCTDDQVPSLRPRSTLVVCSSPLGRENGELPSSVATQLTDYLIEPCVAIFLSLLSGEDPCDDLAS